MGNTTFIKNTIELSTQFFNNNSYKVYADKLKTVDKKGKEAVVVELMSNISTFTLDIFILVTKSVLSGEYISYKDFSTDVESFRTTLYQKETECLEAESLIDKGLRKTEEIRQEDLNNENDRNIQAINESIEYSKAIFSTLSTLYNELISILNQYTSIILIAERKLRLFSDPQKLYFSEVDSSSYKVLDGYLSKIKRYSFLLVRLDYTLSLTDKDSIISLIKIYKELKKEREKSGKDQDILQILFYKCNYLLSILFKTDIQYSINYEEQNIKINDLEFGFLDITNKYNNILSDKGEYDFSKNQSLKTTIINVRNKRERDGNQTLLSFVHSMKYYKNGAKDISSVDKLINIYDEQQNENINGFSDFQNEYDNYAIRSITSYLHNSRFSLHLSQKNYCYEQLCKEEGDIESIQNNTFIKNYYSYKKASEYLIRHINGLIGNDKILINEIQEKVCLLKTILTRQKDHLNWCESRNFFPFQLPFEESLYATSIEGFRVFIPLITHPIDYNMEKMVLQDFNLTLGSFEKQMGVLELLQKNNILVENVKKSERRNIELLTIFTGAITFLFGTTIEIFNSNNDLSYIHSIKNIAILGFIILLFVSSILLVSPFFEKGGMSWKEYLMRPRNYIFLFIIMGLSFFLYHTYNNETNKTTLNTGVESKQPRLEEDFTRLIVVDSLKDNSILSSSYSDSVKFRIKKSKKSSPTTHN